MSDRQKRKSQSSRASRECRCIPWSLLDSWSWSMTLDNELRVAIELPQTAAFCQVRSSKKCAQHPATSLRQRSGQIGLVTEIAAWLAERWVLVDSTEKASQAKACD